MKWLQPEQGELISSCARHVRLPQPLELGETPQPRAGDVVLARVEEVNPVYPNLEIAEGRDMYPMFSTSDRPSNFSTREGSLESAPPSTVTWSGRLY